MVRFLSAMLGSEILITCFFLNAKHNFKYATIIFIIFSTNCGKDNNQKIYKKFDAIESSTDNKKSPFTESS